MDYLNSKLPVRNGKISIFNPLLLSSSHLVSSLSVVVCTRTTRGIGLVRFVLCRVLSRQIIFGQISFLFDWLCKFHTAFSSQGKGKAEERAGKEHFSPSFPGTRPDKKEGQTSDNWRFCCFLLKIVRVGTLLFYRRQSGRDAPAQQTLFLGGLSLFLNNSFGLKDRRSPMSLRTEGQVETGEAAAAEKQLTFTNSVREAIHWGYTGAECHLLPGPNSFIKPSHKGRHT